MYKYFFIFFIILILTGCSKNSNLPINSPSDPIGALPKQSTSTDYVSYFKHPELKYSYILSGNKIYSSEIDNKILSAKEIKKNGNRYTEYITSGYIMSDQELPIKINVNGYTLKINNIIFDYKDDGFNFKLECTYKGDDANILARKNINSPTRLGGWVLPEIVNEYIECGRDSCDSNYMERIEPGSIDIDEKNKKWNFIEIGYLMNHSGCICKTTN